MFGHRPDGTRLPIKDPILGLTAYLMPQRCDAMVMSPQELDYDKVAAYVQAQKEKGRKISFMSVIIAAYIRTVTMYPEINRFVVNKQLYARNEIAVSFMVLKRNGDETVDDSAVKVKFDPYDTIFDVAERVEAAIDANRDPPEDGNATEHLARMLFSKPIIASVLVGTLKFLDRYGLMPRAVVELSPFHTSLFVTNMASLGIDYIYHHIYNFGTTGMFVSMGKFCRTPVSKLKDETVNRRVIPLGVVADERICNGAAFARVYSAWRKFAENPEQLETPPDNVKLEVIGMPEWVKNPKKKAR